MESRNRNIWIIVVVVAVVLCCCAALVALAVAWAVGTLPVSVDSTGPSASVTETLRETFTADEAGYLKVDSFAGSITVRGGTGDELQVAATRRARRLGDLDRIRVEITPRDGGFAVEASNPRGLRNAWVNLEITVPRDTRLDLDTGSGSVDVARIRDDVKLHTSSGGVDVVDISGDVDARSDSGGLDVQRVTGTVHAWTASGSISLTDVQGDVDAHTNSGSVTAREATGNVQLDTHSGRVRYQGTPQGECRFTTGSGSIVLQLPGDLDATLDVSTGSGSVTNQFSVVGTVKRNRIDGYIGNGEGCQIYARTASGGIDLLSR
jgi:hypothetical protein